MNNNYSVDRKECTIVCTFTGNPTTRHLVVKERVFPSFPVMEGQDYKKIWKEKKHFNNFNPKTPFTQVILHQIGEADEKSLQQQFHGVKTRMVKGKIDRLYAEQNHFIHYELGRILSRIHDSSYGNLHNAVISYSSMDLNFKAVWDYNKNKFVVV